MKPTWFFPLLACVALSCHHPLPPADVPKPPLHIPVEYAEGDTATISPTPEIPCTDVICLTYPGNHSRNVPVQPTFRWQPVAGAVKYRIAVGDTSGSSVTGKYAIIDEKTPHNYYACPLPLGTPMFFRWRIKAYFANGDSTAWSNIHDFNTLDFRDKFCGTFSVESWSGFPDQDGWYTEEKDNYRFTLIIEKDLASLGLLMTVTQGSRFRNRQYKPEGYTGKAWYGNTRLPAGFIFATKFSTSPYYMYKEVCRATFGSGVAKDSFEVRYAYSDLTPPDPVGPRVAILKGKMHL